MGPEAAQTFARGDHSEALEAGNARKGEAPPTKTVYRVKAQIGALNEEAYAQAKLRASCFVLVTNIQDTNEFPAERVLREYKEQISIELQFKAIKEPEFVGPIYVKKAEHLERLAHVVFPIPGKRTSMRPTARMILDSFDPLIVIIMLDGTRALAESPLSPAKMFKALGASSSVYLCALEQNVGP